MSESREAARERARQLRDEHRKRDRRRSFLITAAIVAGVVIVGLIITLVLVTSDRRQGRGPANMVSDGIKIHSSYLAESITPYSPIVQLQMQQLGAGVGSQTYQSELVAETLLHAKVTTQAMVLSFESGFRWVALAMSLGLVLVLLLKKPTSGVAPVGAH